MCQTTCSRKMPPPSPFLVELGRVQKERMKDKLKMTVVPGIGSGVGRGWEGILVRPNLKEIRALYSSIPKEKCE